ncbi:hypothetical protein GM3708_3384 [Geminocystis sp. NIES-3708]|uniref:pentapeptide repeat-containing protein n=1 Tax=Geminocystis sp. NIES-3708 TaxID=1615909 RepID=UPI0005FC72D8|nr:pentapeptide repeat-containing protein [Geminocystis sp. NIES-3708]BAQ62978.1 hypothetical protein GM3708_3384 [Geminocystis sp. NIES-3708]
MSEQIPVNLLKEGKIDEWNQWKSENQDKQRLSFTISSEYFDVEQISKENSTNLVLRDVDLSNTDITLENVELRNCNLTHTEISIENNYGQNIIQIEDCNLENAEFNFNRYSSEGSDEIQLNCISCNFSCSDLTMYLFDQENCISFIDCNFTESSINIAENNSNSNEWSIDFSGCNFTNTDFCGSYFN